MSAQHPRTADPYRDLDVIDSRAPRFNQTTVGVVSLLAVVSGWWPLLALLAVQLAIGLRFGRRYCVPCVAYFEIVQPHLGEGAIEDSRPPRFVNQVGLVVLTGASAAYLVGLATLGAGLGLLVSGLALVAAVTGFCAGCQLYRLGARLRGIRGHELRRIELTDIGLDQPIGDTIVAFGHPLCTDCTDLLDQLRAAGRRFVNIDVRARPELARKYGIALVPTAVEVGADGRVLARLAG